jgi:hypothetical protein
LSNLQWWAMTVIFSRNFYRISIWWDKTLSHYCSYLNSGHIFIHILKMWIDKHNSINVKNKKKKWNAIFSVPWVLNGGMNFQNARKFLRLQISNNSSKFEILVWKWNLMLFKIALKVSFKTTSDSSMQWLQYCLLHRFVPVGNYLKKIYIKTWDTCKFCKEETETTYVFSMCL